MDEPNSKSVTAMPCNCGYLERGANDPNSPFIFDESVNEYHFSYKFRGRDAKLMIYHCPWCGGVASDSHRDSLFHDLNRDACIDINEKTKSCVSIEDVIAILGQPDDDEFTEIKHIEKSGRPPGVELVRRVTYRELYDEMRVAFVQQIDGTLSRMYLPKPLREST